MSQTNCFYFNSFELCWRYPITLQAKSFHKEEKVMSANKLACPSFKSFLISFLIKAFAKNWLDPFYALSLSQLFVAKNKKILFYDFVCHLPMFSFSFFSPSLVQCDQIWLFLEYLRDEYFKKSSQNIWWLLWLLWKMSLLKYKLLWLFLDNFDKHWATFHF